MGRAQVMVRIAQDADLPMLLELWSELLRTDAAQALGDLETLLARSAAGEPVRVVVADVDGRTVGAVLLVVAPISPLNPELLVHAFAPQVLSTVRRRGVGLALMDAAVTFAEERGVGYVGAAAFAASRDANRFFARLGMGPRAVLRLAPTGSVRQRLTSTRPSRIGDRRHVDRVLAVRRGRRSVQASA